ncbi:MAG: ABC transporter permease subunit [Planctomycetes bacterium]|nr:ABC transporter permease subunit [Planctomycetota bacterium]
MSAPGNDGATRGSRGARLFVGSLAFLGIALFALPLVGLFLRAPWSELASLLASSAVHDALRLSLVSSFSALALSVVLGLPIALWLASGSSALRRAARLVVLLPIVLPPVVGGIALLLAYGRSGILGAPLESWLGIALPFTTAGTVVAAAYLGLPFFVLSAEAGLRTLDRRYLELAATLGAGPARRFFTVTLPLVAPSLGAGGLLCWARSLGEFCATQTFAGNLEGTTRTMPLACGVAMERDPALAICLSLILASISLLVLYVLHRRLELAR